MKKNALSVLVAVALLAALVLPNVASTQAAEAPTPASATPGVIYAPFANTTALTPADNFGSTATSTIAVSGVSGTITGITITLNDIDHTAAFDLNVLVVGPGGQALTLWSDGRSDDDFIDANVTIDDAGAAPGTINVGAITGNVSFAPSNYPGQGGACAVSDAAEPDDYPTPGPGTTYTNLGTLTAAFVGLSGANVNGNWNIFVVDDCTIDTGGINGGWAINITDNAVALASSASCVGNDLQVNITAGDGPYNITGTGPGLPANGVAAGVTTLTGPGAWTGVTVTETTGVAPESQLLGDFNCVLGSALTASAVCLGPDLQVTISNGDTPFNITGTGTGLPQLGVSAGIYTLTGPGSWTGVTVAETTGDLETLLLGDYTCASAPPVVVAGIPVPYLGLVLLGGSQPAYDAPGGNPIVIDGVTISLPADADGNGFDTYIVTDIDILNGEVWVGLFVGSLNWAWVPLDNAQVLTSLPIPSTDDSN